MMTILGFQIYIANIYLRSITINKKKRLIDSAMGYMVMMWLARDLSARLGDEGGLAYLATINNTFYLAHYCEEEGHILA